MGYRRYTAQYKAKIVLEVLQGEKELGEIAAENNLNPNMVRNWKKEFLENASAASARMLKTIGQLTLERDFLQDCFRLSGEPVPEFDPDKL